MRTYAVPALLYLIITLVLFWPIASNITIIAPSAANATMKFEERSPTPSPISVYLNSKVLYRLNTTSSISNYTLSLPLLHGENQLEFQQVGVSNTSASYALRNISFNS